MLNERPLLSYGRFLVDCASLVVAAAGLAAGAYGVRRRVLPAWHGAPARLAEIILAIALLVLVAQTLALAGGFVTGWMVAGCLVVGAAGWRVGRGPGRSVGQPMGSPAGSTDRAWALAALAAIAVTVAQWCVGVRDALTHGMTTHDTLFYHGPDVARFVQGGSPLDQSYAYSDPVVNFFPMNSELIHAFGVVLMGFDSLSPFITLAWLGVAFLAAWCIGRPYGLGAQAICFAAIVLVSPLLVSSQPGGMYNDIAVIALILGAAALLMNGADRAPAIIAPAAACGLAVGTKLTALSLVGALTVGLLWLSPQSRRAATLGAWMAVLTVLSGVWFLRNIIDTGNPTPGLELRLGPVSLPNPPLPDSFGIVQYLGKPEVWERLFRPGLESGFTEIWWVVGALGVAGMGLAAVNGRSRAERLLGLAAAFAVIAYFFTPRSGGGIESFPTYFPSNLRYVTVPLALGLALLPLAPPVSRLMSRTVAPLLPAAVIAAVLVLGGRDEHPALHLGIVAATVAAAALFAAGASRRLPRRPVLAVSFGIALIAAVTVGAWRGERSYLADRYNDSPLSLARQLPGDARVAVVGGGGTYHLFGPSLDRTVDRIGSRGTDGSFLPLESCRAWRRALRAGGYRYLYLTPRLVTRNMDGYTLGSVFGSTTPELAWTRGAAEVEELFAAEDDEVVLFKVKKPLPEAGCPPRMVPM